MSRSTTKPTGGPTSAAVGLKGLAPVALGALAVFAADVATSPEVIVGFLYALVLALAARRSRRALWATAAACALLTLLAGAIAPSAPPSIEAAARINRAFAVAVLVAGAALLDRLAAGRSLRLRSEAALAESEARFRALADSIPQLAWMARPDGHIFWYNRRWFDYTGTTPAEMEGWGWRRVHHPDHVDRVVARIQHSWDTGEPWEDTFPLRSGTGAWRWFLSRALPVRDADGRVALWFGTNTDVTEQRAAAEALRESEARLDALFTALPVAVGIVGPDGRLVVSNPEMRRYLPGGLVPARDDARRHRWRGYDADGRPIAPENGPALRALRGETALPGDDYLYARDDGSEAWTRVAAVPLREASGAVTGALLVCSDIDAPKRAEAAAARRAAQDAALADMSRAMLAGGMDEAAVANFAFAQVGPLLGADVCFDYRFGPDGALHLVSGAGVPPSFRDAARTLQLGQAFCGTVAATRTPLAADAARIASDEAGAFVRAMGVQAYCCHPLRGEGGRLLGTLSFASTTRGAFDQDEVAFLQAVCDLVALGWQRAAAEAARAESEAWLRTAQEAAGIGVFERDLGTGVARWSSGMRRLYGLAPEVEEGPLTDEAFLALLHPDDRAEHRARREALRADPTASRYEHQFRIRRADTGATRWIASRGEMVRDATGALRCIRGAQWDITERVAAEEMAAGQARILEMVASGAPLAETLDALAQLVEAREPEVKCGVLVVSEEGSHFCQGAGPSLPGTFRAAMDRLPISRPYLGACGEAADTSRAVLVPDVAAETRYGADWRDLMLASGLRAVRSTPIPGPNGRALGAFAIYFAEARDPTPADVGLLETATNLAAIAIGRWRAETALRALNAELERRVEARTGELRDAERRLAQAQRMEALGQLAGGIAHDFNNVLQAVAGGAALVERRADDPEAVRRLGRMMREAAARGAGVTRRLLAFARRGELRAEAVDAAALLAEMQEILAHTLGTEVEVRTEVAPTLPPLLADKGQLETVLVNLATNARDAMPEGGTLTLSAATDVVEADDGADRPPGLGRGRYVRLSVADTGVGMPPEVLMRVAEPFFTTKARGKGTGLGLAMAKGFAEQSGGGLGVESAPDRGTTVRLWLPVAEAGAAGSPPRSDGWRPEERSARASLLLVDDDESVRGVLAEGLGEAGYSVAAAPSGADALAMLDDAGRVDVLVSDLSMPGMSGIQLIREVQRRRPSMPAILLTGHAGDAAALAVGGAVEGAFVLLRKPITPAELAEQVDALLEQGGGADTREIRPRPSVLPLE